ncbi:efflux transporter outer membrane subunit [uncultured Desulfosarcina sp.]|uniref:efflux transporter outer membrane subunit n=1 Tax=uncultured Desulfosarcina sp. TaxID=218289 RepID=UPI0029C684F6|nr:efflux transporter outer membrane subunit [uncultured Desulfosarcina sp.]
MRYRGPRRYLSLALLTGALVSGCQSHTIDRSPEPIEKGGVAFSIASPATKPVDENWWLTFNDAKLDSLIAKALDDNFDIMRGLARLDQADAFTRKAGTAHLPQVDLEASILKDWADGDTRNRLNTVGGALAWEVDVFNRLGSAALARQSEQAARMEDLRAIRLSLSAEVTTAYFDVVEQRSQLALLDQQIILDRDLLELTELRFEAGLTASVDVLQQSSQLAETESLVPPTEALLRVSENRLDVLIGQAPDAVDRVDDDDGFVAIGDLPFIGVPSDLLLNRPDLRSLRNELVAADAEIGIAIAERLPRITLDGSFFYADGSEFSGPAGILLGSIVQPLVDWGARKAEVERSRALYIERLAIFSQAYLSAIEDVENTLYQERKQREFLDRLERRRGFLERTVEETRDRYTNGLTDFLPVLDALKELQRIERIIVRQKRALLGFRIQLHRALGGRVNAASSGGPK